MKTKILSILALLLMTVTQGAWAQETLTVYDGTADNQYIPMYGYSFNYYTKSECIIPASVLTAMKGGTITAITFYANTLEGSNTTFGNAKQQVFLKEVSETTLSSYSGTTGATVVFDGTLPMPTTSASGYTITFSQGYTYNGGNLLIGIYNDTKGSWKTMRWYGIDNQSSGVSAYGASNDNLANAAFKAQKFLPKTTFTYTPAPTAVDLGLPSGKKWANRNVGAGSETGYGTYFAWSSSDIATAQWGSNWRMPTKAEIEELKSYTDHEWATIGGVNGMKFMKKTDHSVYIFLPATGLNSSENVGSVGFYWTSTEESSTHAYFLYASSSTLATSYKSLKTDKLPIRPVQMFAGEGTEASPYLISSTTDWNNLSAAVNGGETYSGKYFKMTANIGTVTTMIGVCTQTEEKKFLGVFDGGGHTLTVNYSYNEEWRRTCPFPYTGASTVIRNLTVAGSITNSMRASGLVGTADGAKIQNCRVSATISGNPYTAAFTVSGGQIENCLFDGKLTGTAGFVGYRGGSGTSITNCLFKPQTGSSIPQCTFISYEGNGAATVTNSYYTSLAGSTYVQGTDGSGMTAAQLVQNLGPSNWKVVDGNAIPKVHPGLSGLGTQASPYLIASTTDWNNLVSAVNGGETYSGNYFKMTANVGTVSTWMTGTFSGTFDGDGKTLTVGYSTSARYCAPFGTLGGTVKNLRVAGTVSTSGKNFGGIAAQVTSGKTATIQNCRVSTSFTSTLSGDNSSGSFVGVVWNGGTLNITGCAFTGSLTGSGNAFGGFLGYKEDTGTCSMTDCLFAPASVTVSTEYAGTFSRPSAPTITNCYFTRTFGTAQGLQARSISAGDYVTVANAGAATVYNVSGITSYGTGIKYNNVLYAGSGDNVSLNITAPAGHVINTVSYTYEGGSETTMNPVNGVYSITMPDANVTINVTFVGVSREIAGYGNDDQDFTKWVFIASPVSGSVAVGNVGNLTDATEEYNLYRFNQAADLEWENIKAVDNQGDSLHPDFKTLVNGHGYLYASKNDVTLMFMGPFNMKNDTTIALDYTTDNTDAGMRGWNLVGNPFPVRAYITDRSYYKISTDGTRVDPKEVSGACAIDSCSGVMVKANATGEVVTFSKTPAEQSTNNGNLHIALGQTVFDRAGVSTGSTTLDKAIVSFNEGSALGKFYFGNQNANIYIPQNGKDYAIASVSAGTDVARYVSTEVPVNFKANENGTYTISVNPEGVEMAYLHLIDNMTGSDVDLLALRQAQGPATYTFTAKTTDYESRFKLVFVANNDEDGSSTGSETFAFYSNGNWIIANDGDATLQVIDLNGRILSSESINGSVSKAIDAVPGVYMIRLINGENVKVQKVVIE